MSGPQMTAYRAQTGYDPIDAVRYGRETVIDPFQHRDTDILMYRMIGNGNAGTLTEAVRGTGEPDLLFLSPGTGNPACGKVAGSPFVMEPHRRLRATFIPRDIDTSIQFTAAARSTNLMFPHRYLERVLADEYHGGLIPKLFIDDDRLSRLIQMLEAEIAAPGFVSAMMIEGLTRAIASILVQVNHERLTYEAERIYLPAWKLRRVDDYIEANLDRNIRLGDLAALTGLSVFHFSRVFKRATGSTPYHYVSERRIAYSCKLLAAGDLDMTHVAAACGFANQSHFTSAFTKAMGISPGRYRRNLRFSH
ncbi:AraC family transcriptional regulator [Sphingomonas sp. CCH10-B3]|uniref:AraC family transcriptional regulator n=2 Tax=Sphingomonas TaxID=13687 RepID=UPI000B2057A9|nr:AraC family transcriptional regulator [Sphingomonas sp. CCH10-B3]